MRLTLTTVTLSYVKSGSVESTVSFILVVDFSQWCLKMLS